MWTSEVEQAKEHCYNAELERWETKKILVRVNTNNIVGSGAMRQCFQMKIAEHDDGQIEWLHLRQQPLESVIPGVGRKTSFWLAQKLVPSQKNISVGNLLDLMYREENLIQYELHNIIHDASKVEEGVRKIESLFEKDKGMRQFWQTHVTNVMAKDFIPGKVKLKDKLHAFKTDVVMQEFSKRLSLAYNAFDPPPPKQIDMLHAGLVELVERAEKPFYAFETFISGNYHKWNTNSGWLDPSSRHTPQAFSFFSYRYTNGSYMVVDIQGIDNLYTDPQVHSATDDDDNFGEGNLGVRGMALFLGTFKCKLAVTMF